MIYFALGLLTSSRPATGTGLPSRGSVSVENLLAPGMAIPKLFGTPISQALTYWVTLLGADLWCIQYELASHHL